MHRPFGIVKPCVCVCVFWLFVCIWDRHNKRKGFSEFKNSQLCCIIFNAFLWDVFRVYCHGYLRLSCLLCHIDQWHCHRPLNIPCTHHSPVSDLHPHLILLQLLCITLTVLPFHSHYLWPLQSSPFPFFNLSSARWRRDLFMMKAGGLSGYTITGLYCNPHKNSTKWAEGNIQCCVCTV